MFNLTRQPWCDHRVLHINRLGERAYFLPEGGSSGCMRLSGTWRFRFFESALSVDQSVIDEEPGGNYADIAVPRSWQFAGYGRMLYTDEAMPFPLDPPYVPSANETGVYKRTFSLDDASGVRRILRLDGAESCATVYVNGSFAGYTQGSRLPAEFDVTQLCRPGENRLCIVVHQYCDGTYLEDQDMWWLGGIIRDVTLITRPQIYIRDLRLVADYDARTGTGTLTLDTELTGRDENRPVRMRAALADAAGKTVCEGEIRAHSAFTVDGAAPWNAEQPVLYTLTVTLTGADGALLETVSQRVGFRRVEIAEGELRVNGKRIMLRGVNRHEFDPENGRVMTVERTREDLLLMKKHHINAVRTSHYPDIPAFYDLCDELGLYVIDECDLETHAFEIEGIPTRLVEDESWREAYLDRARRTVARDRNHACVIMWSLGNESYWGSNFYAMYDWVHAEDPTRPVHYEGDRMSTHTDVTSTMYTSVGGLVELDRSISGKPHILCEFAHAMGNGPGSLMEYVETMEASRRIQGYFVWEWRDHGVKTVREDGTVYYRYGGEFGEDYSSGNFCMDGLLASDSTPTPGFYAYAKAIEPLHVHKLDGEGIELENRFAFRRVDAELSLTLRRNGETVETRVLSIGALAPGERRALRFDRPLRPEGNALFTLQARITRGEELLGTGDCVLASYQPAASRARGALRVSEESDALTVAGEGFRVRISLTDGTLAYERGGKVLIKDGPKLDFFRAFIDNDKPHAQRWQERSLHSLTTSVLSAEWAQEDGCVTARLTARCGGNARNWRVPMGVTYAIRADGVVTARLEGRFDGDFGYRYGHEVPRIGTTLRLPREYGNVTYCAYGPGESYCDSRQQARKDVFRDAVDTMAFPYECPQDSGNRTGADWIALTSGEEGMVFASLVPRDVSAHRCTAKDLWHAAHACDVPRRDFVELHIDLINSGLGSSSCGPQHLAGYAAQTLPFVIEYAFAPTAGGREVEDAQRAMDALVK